MANFRFHQISNTKKIRHISKIFKNSSFIVFLHGFMSDLEGKKPKVFFNFARRNNVSQTKINIMRSENNLLQRKLDLENTVNQSYNDADGAFKAYQASLKLVQARELAFNYAKDKFDVGAMNAFDFTQAKQRYELSQSELIRTKYDYIFKLKVLEFYFGVPISIN